MKLFSLVVVFFLLAGCAQKRVADELRRKKIMEDGARLLGVNPDQSQVTDPITAARHFSSDESWDGFRLQLEHHDVLHSDVHFTITALVENKRKVIWEDVFPSTDLLDFTAQGLSDSVKREQILVRMQDFFYDDQFDEPAINSDEVFPEDGNFASKENWESIRDQKNSYGFTYLKRKTNSISIAYDRKQKKVVIYRSCC